MTRRELLLNIIAFSILPISIYSVIPYSGSVLNVLTYLNITTVWWLIISIILSAFMLNNILYLEKGNRKNMNVVLWYLLWNVVCIVRGTFIAQTYWDWKGLVGNTFALVLPIIAYTATNKTVLQRILTFYVKYALPFFIIVILSAITDAYGFYLVPISFLMLFYPIMTKRWKYLVAFLSLFVMTVDLGARSNVIKFGVPVFVMLIYYFKNYITVTYFEITRLFLMIIPLVLVFLGVSGLFNVFEIDKYVKGNYNTVDKDAKGNAVEDDLKADTRTFLYVEVLYTAQVYNSWLIGRTPARGTLSEAFGEGDENGRGERLENEVGSLNVFTWTGLVGLVLYMFVFFKASYIAINRSNNIFSKIMGLVVAFRWAYSWIEDVNSFTLNYLMLWLMIGFCFSKSFRNMSNREITYWVRSIFNVRIANYFKYNKLESESKVLE